MKTPRTFRTLARSLLGAALTSASAFAVTPDDLSQLRAKAETGDGIAQHNLGLVYANPQENISDLVEAYAWLNLAADNGATGRSLVIVTRQMTPAQIDEGKRRIEQIRQAIAAKRSTALPSVVSAAPAPSPISPAAASPVSASPISPVVASAEREAQQAELKKISAELADAWKENEQLKAAAAKAAQDANAAAAAIKTERDQLATSLENSTREIATMKAAAANFEGERNGLLQKIEEARKATEGESRLKLVALETELGKANAAAKELEATKRALDEQQAKLAAENQRLAELLKQAGATSTEQSAANEKALAAVRTELTKAQAALAAAGKKTADGEKAAKELADAQTRIRELESAAERLSGENKALNARIAAAVPPSELARLNNQISEMRERLAASQQALAQANAEVASVKLELQGAKADAVPMQQHRELQAKLDAASKAAESQTQALADLKKAHDALETDKARLSAEQVAATAASADEIARMKAAAANFEGERNGLLQKIAETEKAQAQAAEDAAALKKQLEVAQAAAGKAEQASTELARANAELDGLKKAHAAAQLALNTATTQATSLKEQLLAARKDSVSADQLAALQARLDGAEQARDAEQKARTDLQASISVLESEREELTRKLSAANSAATDEVAALKAAAANFEGERNGLMQKIAEEQQARTRAADELSRLKEQLALAAKSGEAPAQQIRELEEKLTAATRAQEAQVQQQAALQEAKSALEAEGARLARELAAAQAAATAATQNTGALDELQSRLKAAEQTAASVQAERDALAQRVASLEQQAAKPAAQSGEDPAELRKQLDEASTKLAATLRSFQMKENEIDLLQKSLVSTDNERSALAEHIRALEKQAADARAASAGAQEAGTQLAGLREQLRQAQNQIGQLEAENTQLKNRPASPGGSAPAAPVGLVLSAPRRPADTSSPTNAPVRAAQVTESRIHTVAEGETLTRIARRYYGNSERWVDIYDANRASLPNPASLKIGMKLRIP